MKAGLMLGGAPDPARFGNVFTRGDPWMDRGGYDQDTFFYANLSDKRGIKRADDHFCGRECLASRNRACREQVNGSSIVRARNKTAL